MEYRLRQRILNAIRRHCPRIIRQEEGAVAIIFGLFLVLVMIPVLALTIDLGGGFMMAAQMQNAATASSIASAIENADVDEAERYFAANLPVGQDLIDYDFSSDVAVNLNPDNSVSVIPTNFERPGFFSPAMKPQGVSIIKASSLSVAGLPEGIIQPTNFAFVLDKSGSMDALTSSPKNGSSVMRTTAVAEAFDIIMTKVKNASQAADNYSVAVSAFSSIVAPQDKFDFTDDFDQAIAQVYGIMQPAYNTCGACGISEIRNYLPNAPGNNRKLVFIWMTDGFQNVPFDKTVPKPCLNTISGYSSGTGYVPPVPLPAGIPPFTNTPSPTHCFKKPNDLAAAECQLIRDQYPNAEMWTIGFGPGSQTGDNIALLTFCASTPDKHIYVDSGANLGQVFNQIITQAIGARLKK